MPLQIPKCECGDADVQVSCIQCEQSLCTKCDEKMHWSARFKQHERRPYAGIDIPSQRCDVKGHEKQVIPLYCRTCTKFICALCLLGDHKLHSVVPLEEATAYAKDELKAALVPIQERITKTQEAISTLQKKNKDLQDEIQKNDEKIKERKQKISEDSQKIEDIKRILTQNNTNPFELMSVMSKFKLEKPILQGIAAIRGIRGVIKGPEASYLFKIGYFSSG